MAVVQAYFLSEKPTGSYEISNFSSGVPDEEYAIVPITGVKYVTKVYYIVIKKDAEKIPGK